MDKKRTRNWATVVYPESAPENWRSILEEQCIPAFISPLHDKDLNENGEVKKGHFHIMLLFDGVKTQEQVQEIFSLIGGVGVEPVNCVRAYARYLCHLDNPEKAQYNCQDVVSCSGADYSTIISLASDKYTAIGEMMEFCIQNAIDSYAELLIYSKNNRFDWFKVLCDNGTVTIVQFLKSRYWEAHTYKERWNEERDSGIERA